MIPGRRRPPICRLLITLAFLPLALGLAGVGAPTLLAQDQPPPSDPSPAIVSDPAGSTDPTTTPATAGAAMTGAGDSASALFDSSRVALVEALIRQSTTVAEHALTLTEPEDITAAQFWERDPLGFDQQAFSQLWSLLTGLPGRWQEITQSTRENRGPLSLFIVLTALALVLTYVVRRQVSVRIARELGQSLQPLRARMPSLVSRFIVSLVRFLTAILAPVTILAAYRLVLFATGIESLWFRGLGDFLLAWTILTIALAILHELLLGGLLPVSREHGRRLYFDFRRPVLFGFIGMVAIALAERAGAPDSVLNLGRFVVRLGVLLMAAFALRRREAVLGLFPPFENRAYQAFLRWLRRFYSPAVFLTLVVLLAWLMGYGRLARFLLVRSWMLVAIFVITVGLHTAVLSILRRWIITGDTPSQEAREFYRATVLLVTYVTVIGVGLIFLHILGILHPISRVLSAEIATVGEQTINLLVFVEGILVILIFVFVGQLVSKYLDFQVYPALHVDSGVSNAVNTMIIWLLVAMGIVTSLNTVGLNLRVLSLLAGGLGIGIGFGLQSFARNVVSGLTLIFGRNLRRGDFVTVVDNEGFVQRVGIRVTHIRTRDHIEYTIPNSAFLDNMIINWSHTSPYVRSHVPIGVAYSSDPEHVRRVLLDVARANDYVEESPPPQVWFVGYGNSSIDFELLVWINVRRVDRKEIASEIYFEAFAALRREGIEIPFPQRDLHIRSGLHAAAGAPATRDQVQRPPSNESDATDDGGTGGAGGAGDMPDAGAAAEGDQGG
jgi:small-conductance mechanosensitive channel